MYATYSMSSICSMYSMQHAAATRQRDRIREDYAKHSKHGIDIVCPGSSDDLPESLWN